MTAKQLAHAWFEKWRQGDYQHLPITDDFIHTSPYGTIHGREAYLALVEANKDKFLGHEFQSHDLLSADDRACIRYTAVQGDFRLEVTEWHYVSQGKIREIVAYYNIPGEISEERKLADLEV